MLSFKTSLQAALLIFSTALLTGCIDSYEKSLCTEPQDFPGMLGEYVVSPDNPSPVEIVKLNEGEFVMTAHDNGRAQSIAVTTCETKQGWIMEVDAKTMLGNSAKGLMALFIEFGPVRSFSGQNMQALKYEIARFDKAALDRAAIPYDVQKMDETSMTPKIEWLFVKNGGLSIPGAVAGALVPARGPNATVQPFIYKLIQ